MANDREPTDNLREPNGTFTRAQLASLDLLIERKQSLKWDDDSDVVAEVSAEVAAASVAAVEANAVVGNVAGIAVAAAAVAVASAVAWVAATIADGVQRVTILEDAAVRQALVRVAEAIPLDDIIEVRRTAIARD